jgi:hypothetical protein
MLAYLLEYYTENSMAHVGWMINVTKVLPELPGKFIIILITFLIKKCNKLN